ncbi:MAG: DUF3604 domain-containing protein [Actinobacteria bacterium]|nr:DUF3604 domain-containing protein [Actinomycetota bacterium]
MANLDYYGRATLTPEVSEAGSRSSWVLEYTVGDKGLNVGGGIKVSIFGRESWRMLQTTDPTANEVFGYPDESLVDETGRSFFGRQTSPCCYVWAYTLPASQIELTVKNGMMEREAKVILKNRQLKPREKIYIAYGDIINGEGCIASVVSRQILFSVYIDPKGDQSFVKLPDNPILKLVGGFPVKLKVLTRSVGFPNSDHEIRVIAFDELSNPSKNYCSKVKIISYDHEKEAFESEIEGLIESGSGKFNVRFKKPSVYSVLVRSETDGIDGFSNPVFCNQKENNGYLLFWGEIHGHSYLSDGLESPDYYYSYGRDIEALDFCALTDHDNCMRNRKFQFLPQSPYWGSESSAWAISKYVTNKYYEKGKFVTLIGYEWTSGDIYSPIENCFGNRCVYYVGDDGPLYDCTDEISNTPKKLWALLRQNDAITIPHHSSYPINSIVSGVNWDFHDDEVEPLVEIFSKHGNSEYEGNPYPLIKTRKGGFVQDALLRGYKLGIIAGSDTHVSRPGSEIMEENIESLRYRSGLTAVFATELTRRGIFEAMKNRRCYGTNGERIYLDFRANGHLMGEEFIVGKDRKVKIEVKVLGTDKISNIDLLKNGTKIYSHIGESQIEKLCYDDECEHNRTSWYYVRIKQQNGGMAWSSPIWVKAM